MLLLTKIEEGACYVTDTTNLYVAWSMLCSSSKLFWGCGIIKELDRAVSLFGQAFGEKPEAFGELFELLQNNESSVLDAVRIVICFENYFKAKMLLEGYVIHQMEKAECQKYPQFTKKNSKELLQKTIPILINNVRQAENQDLWSAKSLQTLTKKTIEFNVLISEAKYKAIYSKQTAEDKRMFSVLRRLNQTRNTLHFLSIEYIVGEIYDYVFLRDYVTNHIDALAIKIMDEDKRKLDVGEAEINHMLDTEDIEYDDIEGETK